MKAGMLVLLLIGALFVLAACAEDEETATTGTETTVAGVTETTGPTDGTGTTLEADDEDRVKTDLTGDQEVPPVQTEAEGEFELRAYDGDGEVEFRLEVEDIRDVTAAHIHRGELGENGPVVVTLFAGPAKEGEFDGELARGTLSSDMFSGDLEGGDRDDLLELIRAGEAYVNVHTERNPDGEIRGQLEFGEDDRGPATTDDADTTDTSDDAEDNNGNEDGDGDGGGDAGSNGGGAY